METQQTPPERMGSLTESAKVALAESRVGVRHGGGTGAGARPQARRCRCATLGGRARQTPTGLSTRLASRALGQWSWTVGRKTCTRKQSGAMTPARNGRTKVFPKSQYL